LRECERTSAEQEEKDEGTEADADTFEPNFHGCSEGAGLFRLTPAPGKRP
jgi:hypothetical protein